jgi:hypothetical protein
MPDVTHGARGTRWKDCSAAVAARTRSGGAALLLLVWRIEKLYLAGDVMWDGENSNSDINIIIKNVEHQTCDNKQQETAPLKQHHHSSDPKFRAGKNSVGCALSRAHESSSSPRSRTLHA